MKLLKPFCSVFPERRLPGAPGGGGGHHVPELAVNLGAEVLELLSEGGNMGPVVVPASVLFPVVVPEIMSASDVMDHNPVVESEVATASDVVGFNSLHAKTGGSTSIRAHAGLLTERDSPVVDHGPISFPVA